MLADLIMTSQQIPSCCFPIKLSFLRHRLLTQNGDKNATKIEHYMLSHCDSKYVTDIVQSLPYQILAAKTQQKSSTVCRHDMTAKSRQIYSTICFISSYRQNRSKNRT